MSVRPDLVECWPFRLGVGGELEVLLLRRSGGRIFPGLWQCVTGGLEADERVPSAALRELAEETGLGADDLLGFYDLDQAASFYDERADGVVTSVVFAARIRPEAAVRISHEHDELRWVPAAEAPRLAIWPTYAESVRRIGALLLDPATARWFEVGLDGHRLAR